MWSTKQGLASIVDANLIKVPCFAVRWYVRMSSLPRDWAYPSAMTDSSIEIACEGVKAAWKDGRRRSRSGLILSGVYALSRSPTCSIPKIWRNRSLAKTERKNGRLHVSSVLELSPCSE